MRTEKIVNPEELRFNNFEFARQLSESARDNRTVYPSGQKARVINPNAKPFKLNPPK